MSSWIARILAAQPGYEQEVVDRYTRGLLELARRQLPARLRKRVDPEDVVQSVYRSFFRRLNDGQFAFEDPEDLWRLLTVMTYHKVLGLVRHHQRDRRDVRREAAETVHSADPPSPLPAQREPGAEDVAVLYDCLESLLQELPDKYRDIVALRLQGSSIADIAGKIKRSRRTVLRVLANVRESAVGQLG